MFEISLRFLNKKRYYFMIKDKKTILIDLDGVLNIYNGHYDKDTIPDIKEGAEDFLEYLNRNSNLYLFTTRNLLKTAKWLIKNNLDRYFIDITNTKIPAYLYIDDRAICFKGDYEQTKQEIKKFKTYWKKL